MSLKFSNIGVFIKPNRHELLPTVKQLIAFLQELNCTPFIEEQGALSLVTENIPILPASTLVKNIDLAIVVGGDGSILGAARASAPYNVPIVGINRGQLGFLADIKPKELESILMPILQGEYQEESRILLEVTILRKNGANTSHLALNDVVVFHSDKAKMISYELYIDNQYVTLQRADGIITATPTGSTAYSLSAGGPILYPTLNSLVLVPMFPHTLSSRPIVIDSNSVIKLIIPDKHHENIKISCDGQEHIALECSEILELKKHDVPVTLLHPKDYNYFHILRNKLGWSTFVSNMED